MKKVLEIFRSNTAQTVSLINKLAAHSAEIMTCHCAENDLVEYYKLAKE